MNLVDDLGNDLAIAFLVEKKYVKKISSKESLALIGKIKATLHRISLIEAGKTNPPSSAQKSAGIFST